VKPVGYLFNSQEGLEGERGLYFDYILASNGLFIEAENKLVEARIPVAACEIRGLAPLKTKFILTFGSIPQRFFDLALNMFLADTTREHYVAVIGDSGYHFHVPAQEREGGQVVYECEDRVVLDLHSHGTIGAWFSNKDDKDDKGLKVYGVIGNLAKTPIVKLRLGVYGYYLPLSWKEVFDGTLAGAVEHEKEVMAADELQDLAPGFIGFPSRLGSWLWRHR
jgi:PRTRC genetic system protein A